MGDSFTESQQEEVDEIDRLAFVLSNAAAAAVSLDDIEPMRRLAQKIIARLDALADAPRRT